MWYTVSLALSPVVQIHELSLLSLLPHLSVALSPQRGHCSLGMSSANWSVASGSGPSVSLFPPPTKWIQGPSPGMCRQAGARAGTREDLPRPCASGRPGLCPVSALHPPSPWEVRTHSHTRPLGGCVGPTQLICCCPSAFPFVDQVTFTEHLWASALC